MPPHHQDFNRTIFERSTFALLDQQSASDSTSLQRALTVPCRACGLKTLPEDDHRLGNPTGLYCMCSRERDQAALDMSLKSLTGLSPSTSSIDDAILLNGMYAYAENISSNRPNSRNQNLISRATGTQIKAQMPMQPLNPGFQYNQGPGGSYFSPGIVQTKPSVRTTSSSAQSYAPPLPSYPEPAQRASMNGAAEWMNQLNLLAPVMQSYPEILNPAHPRPPAMPNGNFRSPSKPLLISEPDSHPRSTESSRTQPRSVSSLSNMTTTIPHPLKQVLPLPQQRLPTPTTRLSTSSNTRSHHSSKPQYHEKTSSPSSNPSSTLLPFKKSPPKLHKWDKDPQDMRVCPTSTEDILRACKIWDASAVPAASASTTGTTSAGMT